MRTRIITGLLIAVTANCIAQEHTHETREKLGAVHFTTSCNADAQTDIDRAVALLHSFQFSRAIEGFRGAVGKDSTCGIAFWGIALSDWSNPFAPGVKDKGQLRAGREAVQRGAAVGAKTERERAYLAAVGRLYRDFESTPQRVRLAEYRDAMGELAAKYTADHEAQIFYALAISAAEDPSDKTYAGRLKAGAMLEKLFAEEPMHPDWRITLSTPTTCRSWRGGRWRRHGGTRRLRPMRRMRFICHRIRSREWATGTSPSRATWRPRRQRGAMDRLRKSCMRATMKSTPTCKPARTGRRDG